MRPKQLGARLQDTVAHRMAMPVVDLFEMVDIDDQEADTVSLALRLRLGPP